MNNSDQQQARNLIEMLSSEGAAVNTAALAIAIDRQGEIEPVALKPIIRKMGDILGESKDMATAGKAFDLALALPEFAQHRRQAQPTGPSKEQAEREQLLARFGLVRRESNTGLQFRGEAPQPGPQRPTQQPQQQPEQVQDERARLLAEYGLGDRLINRSGLQFKGGDR